jgi:hypothetical protein
MIDRMRFYRSSGGMKRIIQLWLLLLIPIGCVRPIKTVPTVIPSIAINASDVQSGREYVNRIIAAMPSWDADALSQYERKEIATVKADVAACEAATDPNTFLAAVDKLVEDSGVLMTLDDNLKRNKVI